MSTKSSSKRLAKNTILLYARSLFVMVIGLFTSRVVLKALGVDDYGTYNIVGGFVSFFGLLSGTLVATTQRYLNFELGKGDGSNPKKIFGAAMCIHIALALILFVLLESVGLWFLNYKLNIPSERLVAANWVFQFSIISFLVNIISTPYNAVIIAHERMSAFAYISILDVLLKLLVVYLLYLTPADKLIMYAFLLMIVSLINRSIYQIYCHKKFREASFTLVRDKSVYKDMIGFAGMNFIGAAASLLSNHGMNIVLNVFFGVTINAARAIAVQVQHATVKFVTDFMTALKPQITKEYAAGNHEHSKTLCFRGSKFSYFLMLIMSLPLVFRTPYILGVWLGEYPEYAVLFTRCTLILSLCTLLSNALITEILATGNLTSTTFWIGGVRLMTLPIAYAFLKCGFPPEYSYYTLIGIEIISLFIRLEILEKITKMNFVMDFIRHVLIRVVIVSVISIAAIFCVDVVCANSLPGFVVYVMLSVCITSILVTVIGLSSIERSAIIKLVKSKVKKI